MEERQIEKVQECCIEKWKGCCCICKNHLPEHIHCTTIKKRKQKTCVCNIQIGWTCVIPEEGIVYSRWSEHGMCELFEKKEEKLKK